MKRIASIVILLTIILSTLVLPGCKDDIKEKWNSKLENTYLLDTPLSRFFIDNGNKKTLNSYVKVYILGENDSLDIDFFGSKYIKNIENVTYTYRVRQNPYSKDDYIRCTEYTLELHKDTKFNLLYVAYRMSKLPNVFTVDTLVDGDWLCAIPNDEYYTGDKAWGMEMIEIEKVWDFSTGSSSVSVGVLDTGVSQHLDLNDNLVSGFDFINGNSNAFDDLKGHGTHIAGIIGAQGNNNIGIAGANWNVSVVPLQVLDRRGALLSTSDLENALYYAIFPNNDENNPVDILNLSFGSYVDPLFDAVEMLENYEGLIVCAAGNDGLNTDYHPFYPAYYGSDLVEEPIDNIIVVGAIGENGDRSVWPTGDSSNYGTQTVDIYAPGSNIYSTYLNGQYEYLNGTSMAAPYVSGVAALLLSINPDLSTAQLKDCLLSGADIIEIDIGYGATQSAKTLNAWGSFVYMLRNYTPSITLGENTTQTSITIDENNVYKPIVKINIPYDEEFVFTVAGTEGEANFDLYDYNMNLIETTKTWLNNGLTVETSTDLSQGTYYLMSYCENTIDSYTLNISVSHEHTFDDYKNYSETHHQEACACGYGAGELSPHVAKTLGALIGKGYCIYCGAYLDLYNNGFPSIMSITKYSINGSYILPNGIIVLVDEDIEAYLNGTLVFYDKNNVPQTQ